MMTNTLMNNLHNNLRRVDDLQNQLSSGRRHANISDNPTALIFESAARNKITRTQHYQEMVSVSRNWLTQAEAGTMEVNKVMRDIYEELARAGGTMTPDDRQNIAKAVGQMKDHFVDSLNTPFGDRFVFGGYNTPGDFATGRNADGLRPFAVNENGDLLFNGFNTSQFDGLPSSLFTMDLSRVVVPPGPRQAMIDAVNDAHASGNYQALNDLIDEGNTPEQIADNMLMLHQLMNDVKSLEVGPGITMPITMNGMNVLFYQVNEPGTGASIMRNAFNTINDVFVSLNGAPERPAIAGDPTTSPPTLSRPLRPASEPLETDDLTWQIGLIQGAQDHMLNLTAEIGGRQRRLDMLEARYERDIINFRQMQSDAADADIAEVIMDIRMAETVYQAALSAGARVIQPTLMDFLR